MRELISKGAARRLKFLLARFRAAPTDQSGMAAVEFSLIVPVLLTMSLGAFGLSLAVSADKSVTSLARTLADVTSQQPAGVAMQDATMQDIMNASQTLLGNLPTDTLKMTVSNVEFVANSASSSGTGYDAKTRWTVTFDGGTLRPCASGPLLTPTTAGSASSPTTMPKGLYAPGFLIVADVVYTYTPVGGLFVYGSNVQSPASVTLHRTVYMRPRQTDNIRYAAGQTAQVCAIASPQSS